MDVVGIAGFPNVSVCVYCLHTVLSEFEGLEGENANVNLHVCIYIYNYYYEIACGHTVGKKNIFSSSAFSCDPHRRDTQSAWAVHAE